MFNLVLFGLKFVFVALLYVFIFALVRTVIKDTKLVSDNVVEEAKPARLVADFGKSSSKSFALTEKVLIGRSETADISLEDNFLSSNHVRITRQGQTYVIQDLKSTNGTLLNGEPIKKATLNDGDEIAIGQTKLKFLQ